MSDKAADRRSWRRGFVMGLAPMGLSNLFMMHSPSQLRDNLMSWWVLIHG